MHYIDIFLRNLLTLRFLIKDAADMEIKLAHRRSKYELYGFTAQPIPIVLGSIDQIDACYVNVNTVFYKVDSISKAVDLTFKVYHVLEAQYPPEAKLVWLFIQQGIFEIFTEHDDKFVCVSTMISDLKALM